MNTLTLLLHPVRLRIVHAMSGDRTRTTSELCASLSDLSKATVYRHVGVLVEGGVLDVASERRVRGAVERRYRLHRERVVIDRKTAASMSLEEHRHGFTAAVTALMADFNAYLDRKHANPTADFVSYVQAPLWLSRDELAEISAEIRRMIVPRLDNMPGPGRKLYLLSPILFPIEDSNARRSRPDSDE